MSDFTRFMRQNKAKKENTTYAATKSLTDEKGEPLLWEIRPISTRLNNRIIDECTTVTTNRKGETSTKLDAQSYMTRLIAASVVNPDLNNAELQDSYGVMGAEELLLEMVDNPAEFADFSAFIQTFNGFTSLQDKVDEAKN